MKKIILATLLIAFLPSCNPGAFMAGAQEASRKAKIKAEQNHGRDTERVND